MSQSDELLALAKRVQALEGVCRETDARITYACSPLMRELGSVEDYLATDACKKVRAYTSSLDAAMTVVPEGFMWRVQSDPDEVCEALAEKNGGDFGAIDARHTQSFAATPALALTAAALLALAEQVQHDTH